MKVASGEPMPSTALGFLTVVEHPQHGLFGGYLILNAAGRPLEFHCTAPIRPNRAQRILYGPTLEPFLYGEQIGRTLLERAKLKAWLVCTDRPAVLAVRQHVCLPVALVLPADGRRGEQRDTSLRLDPADSGGAGMVALQAGRNRLALAGRSEQDRREITRRLSDLPESFDLAEPFGRIREAIDEAQQAVRPPSSQAV